MQKETDSQFFIPFLEKFRQQKKMIVVYPNKIFRLGMGDNTVGHHVVDGFIRLPVFRVKPDQIGFVMEKRPKDIVANAVIIKIVNLFGDRSRDQTKTVCREGGEIPMGATDPANFLFRSNALNGRNEPSGAHFMMCIARFYIDRKPITDDELFFAHTLP